MSGDNGQLNLGRCCHCECEGPTVRNIVMFELRSPEAGAGCWGCVQCGLPSAGAIAVLCDDCFAYGRPPRLACLGPPARNRRIPIEQLTERFEHDLLKHPEAVVQVFRRNDAGRS